MSNFSRRTLVKGAAWTAPVVAATAVVPAYAASACFEQTTTYPTSGSALGKGVSFALKDSTGTSDNSYTVQISGQVSDPSNAGQTGVNKGLNGSFGKYGYQGAETSEYPADTDRNKNRTVNQKAPRAKNFVLDGLGTGDKNASALILTQSRIENNASSQTVTFSFAKPVKSFSIPIYDFTMAYTRPKNNKDNDYRTYQDNITFSVPVTMDGDTTLLNATSGTNFYRTEHYSSSGNGSIPNLLTATYKSTDSEGIQSFTITYTDSMTVLAGWQAIGLGPITILCP